MHGDYKSNTYVAYYVGWKTQEAKNANPITYWLVMCWTNVVSQLEVTHGVNVGTVYVGSGRLKLQVNQSKHGNQTSDYAINGVVIWERWLTIIEMHEVSDYLMEKLQPPKPTLQHYANVLIF